MNEGTTLYRKMGLSGALRKLDQIFIEVLLRGFRRLPFFTHHLRLSGRANFPQQSQEKEEVWWNAGYCPVAALW